MKRSHRSRRALLAVPVVLILLQMPVPGRAATPAAEFGLGTACMLTNLIYGPVKFLYAAGGGLVGSLAFLFSAGDMDVARPIIDASLRGDYAVTEEHFRGQRPLEFIGRSPAQRQMQRTPPSGDAGSRPGEGF